MWHSPENNTVCVLCTQSTLLSDYQLTDRDGNAENAHGHEFNFSIFSELQVASLKIHDGALFPWFLQSQEAIYFAFYPLLISYITKDLYYIISHSYHSNVFSFPFFIHIR